jgi:hypothetical protein
VTFFEQTGGMHIAPNFMQADENVKSQYQPDKYLTAQNTSLPSLELDKVG